MPGPVLVVIVTGGGMLATVTVCNGGRECVAMGNERALQQKTELCCNGRQVLEQETKWRCNGRQECCSGRPSCVAAEDQAVLQRKTKLCCSGRPSCVAVEDQVVLGNVEVDFYTSCRNISDKGISVKTVKIAEQAWGEISPYIGCLSVVVQDRREHRGQLPGSSTSISSSD